MKLNMRKITKIICICILLLIIFIPTSNVFGEINPETIQTPNWATSLKNGIAIILKIPAGVLSITVSAFINMLLGVVFALLYFIFSPISNGFLFPFPDQIIFNKIPFFDPNFINPGLAGETNTNMFVNTPVVILQELIQNLYYTCFVIAGAVFVVAAMIIGLKLAISTIASDKAHYKQALMTWVMGLFLLFTTHFIMLGIFTVNEQVVNKISVITDDVMFNVNFLELIPLGIGKGISKIINTVAGIIGDVDSSVTDTPIPGYGGLILRFAVSAFGGDLTSSIICGVLLGQTCALIIMYLKRLFYSIILGMIAPLIIAADIIKKTV
ncbi:MAG: hypothetical protein RR144_03805 [Clostridia bacterium]